MFSGELLAIRTAGTNQPVIFPEKKKHVGYQYPAAFTLASASGNHSNPRLSTQPPPVLNHAQE
jgi:hypothetical protein